jgi:hypothetical protein
VHEWSWFASWEQSGDEAATDETAGGDSRCPRMPAGRRR